jgi:hypothetical protein
MSSVPSQISRGRSFRNAHQQDSKRQGQGADLGEGLKRWIRIIWLFPGPSTRTVKQTSPKSVRFWESEGQHSIGISPHRLPRYRRVGARSDVLSVGGGFSSSGTPRISSECSNQSDKKLRRETSKQCPTVILEGDGRKIGMKPYQTDAIIQST